MVSVFSVYIYWKGSTVYCHNCHRFPDRILSEFQSPCFHGDQNREPVFEEFYSATFANIIRSMRIKIESLDYHYNARHITPALNERSSLPVVKRINNLLLFTKSLHRDFRNYFLSISSMEMAEQDSSLLNGTSTVYSELRSLNREILMAMCITSNNITPNHQRHRRNMPCRRNWTQLSHYQSRSLKVLEHLHLYLENLEEHLQFLF